MEDPSIWIQSTCWKKPLTFVFASLSDHTLYFCVEELKRLSYICQIFSLATRMSQGHVFHVVLIVSTQPKRAPSTQPSPRPKALADREWRSAQERIEELHARRAEAPSESPPGWLSKHVPCIIWLYTIIYKYMLLTCLLLHGGWALYFHFCFFWIQVDVICAFGIAFWCC